MSGTSQATATGTGDRGRQLVAVVCVTTRNRPRMLGELLRSLRDLTIPGGVTCRVVVVENDDTPKCEETVNVLRDCDRFDRIVHVLEPEPGIPIARNRALDEAVALDADIILFVDDDEVVAKDWLVALVRRYRESALMLIGGPVLCRFEDAPANAWERGLQRGIEHRYGIKRRHQEEAVRKGREDRITILTNNWLADRALIVDHGIRFDPALRMTGGSDTRLFRDVKAKGLATGWCKEALVTETVPADRISIGYQYRRAVEQSRQSIGERVVRVGRAGALVRMLPIAIARTCHAAGLAIALPFLGSRVAVPMVRSAGWVVGVASGLAGWRSRLYERTTGY